MSENPLTHFALSQESMANLISLFCVFSRACEREDRGDKVKRLHSLVSVSERRSPNKREYEVNSVSLPASERFREKYEHIT